MHSILFIVLCNVVYRKVGIFFFKTQDFVYKFCYLVGKFTFFRLYIYCHKVCL